MFSFYNVYMDRDMNASISFIGTVRAASSLVSIPLVLSTPLLAKRFGRSRFIRVLMLGVSVGFLLLSIRNPWIASAAYIVINGAYGLTGTAFTPFSQEAVGPRHRAVMSGFIIHATTLSWAIMTFGGGAIVDALSFRTLFLITAALPVLGVFAYVILKIDRS
jgi:predicted MFS family arabinose efflux permease